MITGKEVQLHLGDRFDLKLAESRRRRVLARHMKAQKLPPSRCAAPQLTLRKLSSLVSMVTSCMAEE